MAGEILKLFKNGEITETSNGSYKTICPDCGLQGGRTPGFILNPENNIAYCNSSHKHFNLLETAALKIKTIRCLDGKETGERESIFDDDDELLNETLEIVEEVYGPEIKEIIINSCYVKKEISLPVTGKLISEFAKQISKILLDKNILFYRHDSKEIVEIRKIKYDKSGKLNDKNNGFTTITPNRFITLVERYIQPGVFLKNKKTEQIEFHKKSLCSSLAAVLIESHILQDSLPKISRIFTVPMPIMYENKLTFPRKGYDERFESWLPYSSPEITNQSMELTEAKNIINEMFSEFCFKEEEDKINAIAALLTPFLKGLFKGFNTRTPVPFYIANRERAGKDFLAGITGIVYEGAALEEPPISSNENSKTNSSEELRKKILSAMIAGRKRLHFSNNKGFINNAVFESVVTSSQYSDRMLGRNETLVFDNELDLSLSGNAGITYTADFANRCRFINLFLEIEDANSRIFKKPDLHGWVLENRSLILSALYSFINNWIAKGNYKGTIPFTSFQEWAGICGGILEAAGYGSPCTQNKAILAIGGDNETKDMKNLFEACYEAHPNKYITRNDIVGICKKEDLFSNLDLDKNLTRFGIKISKFIGRVLSDIKLTVDNANLRGNRQLYLFNKINEETTNPLYLKEEDDNIIKDAKVSEEKMLKMEKMLKKEKNEVKDAKIPNMFVEKDAKICEPLYEPLYSDLKSSQEASNIGQKGLNSGTLGMDGTICTAVANSKKQNNYMVTGVVTVPEVPRVPNQQQLGIQPEKYNLSSYQKPHNIENISVESTVIKKSDRETQFYDAEECKTIIPNHTKEDVLKWIKENPDGFSNYKELYNKFGVGCLKFRNQLKIDGLI